MRHLVWIGIVLCFAVLGPLLSWHAFHHTTHENQKIPTPLADPVVTQNITIEQVNTVFGSRDAFWDEHPKLIAVKDPEQLLAAKPKSLSIAWIIDTDSGDKAEKSKLHEVYWSESIFWVTPKINDFNDTSVAALGSPHWNTGTGWNNWWVVALIIAGEIAALLLLWFLVENCALAIYRNNHRRFLHPSQ